MKKNNILSRIKTVPRKGGFRMDGFHIWGSSIIKGDDKRYHMFASRVPNYMKFHPGWMVASEIVRATSSTPAGVYEFEEVVLPARGATYWDGCSSHNPKIIKIENNYQ